jgi:hypothetical protein
LGRAEYHNYKRIPQKYDPKLQKYSLHIVTFSDVEQEPQGAKNFGWNRSRIEVLALAPGQTQGFHNLNFYHYESITV